LGSKFVSKSIKDSEERFLNHILHVFPIEFDWCKGSSKNQQVSLYGSQWTIFEFKTFQIDVLYFDIVACDVH
jgi:hypothetical protein